VTDQGHAERRVQVLQKNRFHLRDFGAPRIAQEKDAIGARHACPRALHHLPPDPSGQSTSRVMFLWGIALGDGYVTVRQRV
jgi:hypothetical protein